MTQTFNLQTLVSVQIFPAAFYYLLTYQKASNSFWGGNKKEGFVPTISWADGYELYTAAEVEAGAFKNRKLLVIDNLVYTRPYVKLIFVNNEVSYKREFSTYEEAVAWGKEQSDKGISIKLEI